LHPQKYALPYTYASAPSEVYHIIFRLGSMIDLDFDRNKNLAYIIKKPWLRDHFLAFIALSCSSEAPFVKFRWIIAFSGLLFGSDSVTRVIDSTWLESRWEKWLLHSSHVTHRMTRLESQSMTRVRVIFTKSLSHWWTNPVHLDTKKWAFFASVMIKLGANFVFWLSSCSVLSLKDQLSPTCTEVDLTLWFWLRGQEGIIYWHLIVVDISTCPCGDVITPHRL